MNLDELNIAEHKLNKCSEPFDEVINRSFIQRQVTLVHNFIYYCKIYPQLMYPKDNPSNENLSESISNIFRKFVPGRGTSYRENNIELKESPMI